MKAPQFWYRPPGILSTSLLPLGWIYSTFASCVRSLKKTQKFPIPIISVGNIVCGGAGKTPVALSLAKLLQRKGLVVHFVTRGYKGNEIGPLQVNSKQTPQEVGDEALLLAQEAPTWVAKSRGDGIAKAIENGAELVILDDGHQTKGLVKDISFVVVDSMQGFGNGYPLPAGPLRETLSEGLRRADGFICIGKNKQAFSLQPCFKATLELKPLTLPKKRVVAFCGIGFPQKFYQSVKDMNFNLVAEENFPDHYVYKEQDLFRLEKLAQSHNAVLITTRKDWIKIDPSWQERLHVLDMSVQFQDEEELYHFILKKIPTLMEKS
jgi:tetraacyldisaccharide 4'-kinase